VLGSAKFYHGSISANFSKADVATALKSVIKPKGFTALEGLIFSANTVLQKGRQPQLRCRAWWIARVKR
jgi:hypothetical protein